ncbi:hypothetical protein RIF29_29379 [Crotalaria pallida]|uniref:Uncharacterized protein n=1 Tax=Crotalaria pallida TaxID=3830 RepID=A0AAN9EGM7_CROPI
MGSVQSISRTVVELLMWSRWSELLIKEAATTEAISTIEAMQEAATAESLLQCLRYVVLDLLILGIKMGWDFT